MSFNFEERDVIIRQMQATHIDKERVNQVLYPLKWERMLVSMLVGWSFQNSVNNVMILPAERNIYWDQGQRLRNGLTLEQHQHNLRMRYDVTAKRLGFKYEEKIQLWVKSNPNLEQVAV